MLIWIARVQGLEYGDDKVVRKWLYPGLKEIETKQNASDKTLNSVQVTQEKLENAALFCFYG